MLAPDVGGGGMFGPFVDGPFVDVRRRDADRGVAASETPSASAVERFLGDMANKSIQPPQLTDLSLLDEPRT